MQPVERFQELSLLGLLLSAFLSLATSHALDWPTIFLTLFAIAARAAAIAGWVRFRISPTLLSVLALSSIAIYPVDYYLLSHDFLTATIHVFTFIAALKILTARTPRDSFYIGAVALVELVGSAFLSVQPMFFAWLALFILFAAAAFAGADISRGLRRAQQVAPMPRAGLPWRLSAVTLFATGAIVVLAASLFLVIPRTARAAARFFPATRRISGFTSEVDLGNFGAVTQDKRPVMHVVSYRGALPAGLRWRGTALTRFDGRRWSEWPGLGTRIASDGGTAQVAGQLQRSRRDAARLLYRVDLASSDTGLLFIAGIPEFINISARRIIRSPDDAFRTPHAAGEPVSYEVSAHSGAPLPAPLPSYERARYLQLPPIDSRIWSLARDWTGLQVSSFDRARSIEQHLHKDFSYTLDTGDMPVRDPLARFLFETRSGYCEYFASAMAVMLRTQSIPSRVVTGFVTGYYNDVSGQYVIRASDAHAWVEAWIEGRGWATFDPTPAAPATLSRLGVYLDAMDTLWQQWVVSYDITHQAEMAARLHRSVESWQPSVYAAKVAWILLAIPVWVLWPRVARMLRRKRALRKVAQGVAGSNEIALVYRVMLRRLERKGFRKPAWLTPLEFARSLPAPERAYAMEVTELYNAARFGNDREAATDLALTNHRRRR